MTKPKAQLNRQLADEFASGVSYQQIADMHDMSYDAVRDRIRRTIGSKQPASAPAPFRGVAPSQMPRFDQPLKAEGDGAILFDVEVPFHNSDFLNRVLELAYTWKIDRAILGGDILHFDSFSHWEANWKAEHKPGDNLTPETAELLREKLAVLPENYRAELAQVLDTIPVDRPECDELAESRRVLESIGQLFEHVDFVLGNHDARFLHALNSPMLPRKLLDFVGGMPESKWRVAPYYFSILVSGGETFRIEHPKSAAALTAVKLADKYECSVLCGHSHLWGVQRNTSGRHWAIQAGCIVDETRLAYAAQRSTNRPAHILGAVIIRGGYPYTLTVDSQWDRLKRM